MAVAQRDSAPQNCFSDFSRSAAASFGLNSILAEARHSAAKARIIERHYPVETGRELEIAVEAADQGVLVPSHRGIDSTRILLSIDGHRPSLVVKTVYADQIEFYNAAAAFDAQGKAAALGVCPAILASNVDTATSVMDYLDGWATARVSDVRCPDLLDKVLSLKRSIHSGKRFQTSWTVFDRIRMLEARFGTISAESPVDVAVLRQPVKQIEDIIEASGVDTVPAHADGLASNILIGPDGRVQLVDFDEARNVDPYYEFGILLNEIHDDKNDALAALEMFEGRPRRDSFHRARLYAIADDFAWGIWGLLMDATSPRTGVEFWRYACLRLTRCRLALEATDLDHCNRMI